MEVSRVSDKNFGMKITDNIPFYSVQQFLAAKNPAPHVRLALEKIKKCVNDSFELTFKEFNINKPCEVLIRKQPFAPQKFFITFDDVKEKVVKIGRSLKHPESRVYNILSLKNFTDLITRKVRGYDKSLSN